MHIKGMAWVKIMKIMLLHTMLLRYMEADILQFNFSSQFLAFIMAAISGVFMAVQGSLNASLSKVIGALEATFVVHLIGTVVLLAVLFGSNLGKGNLALWQNAPWYSYLGGLISIFIIYLVAASIPVVGMGNATTAIIVGQVLTALAIDYFGLFGLERFNFAWQQAVGIVLLAVGAKLLLR